MDLKWVKQVVTWKDQWHTYATLWAPEIKIDVFFPLKLGRDFCVPAEQNIPKKKKRKYRQWRFLIESCVTLLFDLCLLLFHRLVLHRFHPSCCQRSSSFLHGLCKMTKVKDWKTVKDCRKRKDFSQCGLKPNTQLRCLTWVISHK